jgi:Predicted methyltransferase (contains TPR repeat)
MENYSKHIDFNPEYYYDAYFTKKNILTHVFYRMKMDELLLTVQKYKNAPSKVLDCACASGLLSYLLQARNYEVSGFDILEDFVVFAKQKIPYAYIFQSDIRTFESPHSYEVIVCADVIGRFISREKGFNHRAHIKTFKTRAVF